MRRLRKRGRPYCQLAAEQRRSRRPIVCMSWGSGLGLPLTQGWGYHHQLGADPQTSRTGGSTPLLAAAEFHCTIINPHTWGQVITHCNSVCLCSVWLRCRGVQGSKYGFGCDRQPKFAEPRTATARTLADSSFHGMMDKALKLLLCFGRSQC